MVSKTFVDRSPPTIDADWLNDVDAAVYEALGAAGVAPTTAAQVRANLNVPSNADLSAALQARIVSVKDAPFNAAGDGATDDSAAIQAAIDAVKAAGGGEIFFPAGRYVVNSRLKLQQTYSASIFIKLRGVGNGNAFLGGAANYGSIIVGQTGGILLDCAGGSNLTFEDMGFYYGATNPSTIGVLFQRIASDTNCQKVQFIRCSVAMGSNPAANGGVGTIALFNRAGEHHKYQDCWFYGDKAVIAVSKDTTYPSIVSPDFAVSGTASLSLNYFDNCGFVAVTNDCVELSDAYEMHIYGGYFSVPTTKSGVLVSGFTEKLSILNTNIEAFSGGTPVALIRLDGSVVFSLKVQATTRISGLEMIRTANNGSILGFNIMAGGVFGNLYNSVTESGSTMSGGIAVYNSLDGHSVPDLTAIQQALLIDAGATVQNVDLRSSGSNSTNFSTGGMSPQTATTGVDTTPSITETYIAELFLPCSAHLTGAAILQGSAAAGNFMIGLHDQEGTLLAQTASTATGGVTAAYASANFTSAYTAKGPGKYYLSAQFSDAGNRFRTHALGLFGAAKMTGTTYGTIPTISIPGSFTGNFGPIGCVF